jgi:hypothetical protein
MNAVGSILLYSTVINHHHKSYNLLFVYHHSKSIHMRTVTVGKEVNGRKNHTQTASSLNVQEWCKIKYTCMVRI